MFDQYSKTQRMMPLLFHVNGRWVLFVTLIVIHSCFSNVMVQSQTTTVNCDDGNACTVDTKTCTPTCNDETGWMKTLADDNTGNKANCFDTISGLGNARWGWTNGAHGAGTYEGKIYAGAAKCNDALDTRLVSSFVSYGWQVTSNGKADVWINVTSLPGKVFLRSHFYVGVLPLPKKNGAYTVSPGLFPYVHTTVIGENGIYRDYYNVIVNTNGFLYFAYHADVRTCLSESQLTCQCSHTFVPSGTPCDDSNACTVGDSCDGTSGTCRPGVSKNCDDANACTIDSCNVSTGLCIHDSVPMNGTPCTDDNACTIGDVCMDGTCLAGALKNCDDGLACTLDSCNAMTGTCLHDMSALEGMSCSDGNGCTSNDTCRSGICVAGISKICDDANVCTSDSCDVVSGSCIYDTGTMNGATCSDDDACTTNDVCIQGSCVSGAVKNCDDGIACTSDSCNATTGACLHDPFVLEGLDCDDGDACSQTDTCHGGQCIGDSFKNCDDSNECTADGCNSSTGSCTHDVLLHEGFGCTPSSPCVLGGTCRTGVCLDGNQRNCNDDVLCTIDSCNVLSGECINTWSNTQCKNVTDIDWFIGAACSRSQTMIDETCGCVSNTALMGSISMEGVVGSRVGQNGACDVWFDFEVDAYVSKLFVFTESGTVEPVTIDTDASFLFLYTTALHCNVSLSHMGGAECDVYLFPYDVFDDKRSNCTVVGNSTSYGWVSFSCDIPSSGDSHYSTNPIGRVVFDDLSSCTLRDVSPWVVVPGITTYEEGLVPFSMMSQGFSAIDVIVTITDGAMKKRGLFVSAGALTSHRLTRG